MRQTLCDHCGEVIDRHVSIGDEEIVFVGIGIWEKEDAYWKEYHRRCARTLTVAEVWKTHGLVPL